MRQDKRQAILDTIVSLAEDIARSSPESVDRAMKIVALIGEIGPLPDQATVEDAITAETADSDLSETQVRATTRAVVDAMRRDEV